MIVDIGVYSHRKSPLADRCIASVAEHTAQSYNLIVVCQPGSCHRNMNRVLDRSTEDVLIFLDEDVEILQDNWLEILLEDLKPKDVGVVGTYVARTHDAALQWQLHPESPGDWPKAREWIPAHVMAFDMGKCRDFLRFDEGIPWIMGMTDVDACVQLKAHGLRRLMDGRVAVYHPARDDDESRAREQRPTIAEQQAHFSDQVQYMMDKWGPMMVGLRTNDPIEV